MNTQVESIQLLKFLGAGSFGQAYMAKVLDKKLIKDFRPMGEKADDIVAVKIPLSKEKEMKLLKELINNASLHCLLRGVQSRNIVQYLGFGLYRDKYVMMMEFVEGGSLRELLGGDINQKKTLAKEKSYNIMKDVARGVALIHSYNMVHNDLKPENILIGRDGAKIADLGLTKIHTPEVLVSYAGTIPYMAPEVLRFKRSTFHSDIWSLGVIFYEIVTGTHPFLTDNCSLEKAQEKITSRDFRALEETNPQAELRLCKVIQRCLELNPAKRYLSGKELSEDLERIGTDETTELEREILEVNHALKEGSINQAEAERRFAQLKRRYPKDVKLYIYIGEFYNSCAHYTDAIRVLNEAPKDPLVYWTMAYAYQGINQKAKAIFALEKAIEFGLDVNLKRHALFMINKLKE